MGQKVAVVGATGAVGLEMLRVLEQRHYPVDEIRLFASRRSEGTRLRFQGSEVAVEPLETAQFRGLDLALFSTGAELAAEHGSRAASAERFIPDPTPHDRRSSSY